MAPEPVGTGAKPGHHDFGVYVHIPFCAERCDYCAFVTFVGRDDLHGRYVEAVRAEISAAIDEGAMRPATSVFFGGGTPSRLDPALVAHILDAIPRAPGCEVTMEMNPEDVERSRLDALVAGGVTRVSIGIQSTSSHVLADLGRTHRGDSVDQIAALVADCGVSSWSMDLIVGASAEHDEDLRQTLSTILGLASPPPHVSCYLLSVERGTPLSRDPSRHPDDDVLARRYEIVDEALEEAGYSWYEISNWALPGHECRHNQLYWSGGEYLGVGVAAHSHLGHRRFWNVANLDTYLSRIDAGQRAIGGDEELDATTEAFERLALSLRTRRGVPVDVLGDRSDLGDLVAEHEGRLVLTRSGRLVADAIATRLGTASRVEVGSHEPAK